MIVVLPRWLNLENAYYAVQSFQANGLESGYVVVAKTQRDGVVVELVEIPIGLECDQRFSSCQRSPLQVCAWISNSRSN